MTCDELNDLIEPCVAADVSPSADAAEHLRTCARCQAAWTLASRIEQVLVSGGVKVPAHFTDRVVSQTRRHLWRAPDFADVTSDAVASGALVFAGASIWMSLGTSALDLSSWPLALVGAGLIIAGLAWTWRDVGIWDLGFGISDTVTSSV